MRRGVMVASALLLSACSTGVHRVTLSPVATPLATTVTSTTSTAPVSASPTRASRSQPHREPALATPVPAGDFWRRLADCESRSGVDSRSGRYHGYFQFTLSSWAATGRTGDPHTYSYDEQRAGAIALSRIADPLSQGPSAGDALVAEVGARGERMHARDRRG